MDQIKLLFFCKKYFFTSFYLHLISKLGPDSNTEKNSKHWRQYMQNFLRTPLIREFYRNTDSNYLLTQIEIHLFLYEKKHFVVKVSLNRCQDGYYWTMYCALNLEKSAISKVQKITFFAISKMAKKTNFAPEKSSKIPFLVVLNFFLCKNGFFAIY